MLRYNPTTSFQCPKDPDAYVNTNDQIKKNLPFVKELSREWVSDVTSSKF